MRLFILYNLQLEISNFLYKNFIKAGGCLQLSGDGDGSLPKDNEHCSNKKNAYDC
jgi:hypothetical protein